jgi:hypothetical protein
MKKMDKPKFDREIVNIKSLNNDEDNEDEDDDDDDDDEDDNSNIYNNKILPMKMNNSIKLTSASFTNSPRSSGQISEFPSKNHLINNNNSNNNKAQTSKINSNSIQIKSVTEDQSKDYISSSDEDNDDDDDDDDDDTEDDDDTDDNENTNPHNNSSYSLKNSSKNNGNNNNRMIVTPYTGRKMNTEDINRNSSTIAQNSTNESDGNTKVEEQSEDLEIDYSIYKLLESTNSKDFCLQPSAMNLTIKAQVFRVKSGFSSYYKFIVQSLDTTKLQLIMTARKKKKSKTTCYIIYASSTDNKSKNSKKVKKPIQVPIAKLKSNLIGTKFSLYDYGIKPSSNFFIKSNSLG